ncbi:hypothetical protein LUT55_004655 [Escherichia coli]|nr:hypothetical protein [Escherichia coli]
MKKVLLGFSALAVSFTALAGGGGASWQPSVSPAYCVSAPAPQEEIKWRNIGECQEVIEKGYAMGVAISGKIIYQGGQITRGFSGIVTPNQGVKVNAPQSIDGAKFTGVAEVKAEWLK